MYCARVETCRTEQGRQEGNKIQAVQEISILWQLAIWFVFVLCAPTSVVPREMCFLMDSKADRQKRPAARQHVMFGFSYVEHVLLVAIKP